MDNLHKNQQIAYQELCSERITKKKQTILLQLNLIPLPVKLLKIAFSLKGKQIVHSPGLV